MPEQRGFLRRILSAVASLVLFVALLGAGIGAYWYLGPFRDHGSETFVEIEHGMSSRQIAGTLARQGVVRSAWAFLAVRLVHPHASLQAGEYRFASAQTPWQVFDKIRRGDVFYEELTVPEGDNIFDIAALLDRSGTISSEDFLHAAADPTSIRDLDPLAPSLEGFLFPSTYRMTHKTTAQQLCRVMTTEFRKQWAGLNTPSTTALHRVVTLASLVEKESALSQERPLIAAVFTNRLRLGMPLQCDPSSIYAALLENRYSGVIHKSDLASANPYNTYTHAALPPGPIANPGVSSLKAALEPAAADYLYFVARPGGSGSHQFSDTLKEHEIAVQEYRKALR